MASKKALVTGGAGFIGSHLVDRLIGEGFDVTVVDDLSSGRKGNLHSGARVYDVDIVAPGLEQPFAEHSPDVVFHLAAQASVVRSMEDPITDARINVIGSLNLLQLCRRYDVRRVVYSSTGGVMYGDPKHNPCSEDVPATPLSAYGITKAAVEQYMQRLSLPPGFVGVSLRYGNVYGPRQNPHGEAGVIAIFSMRMLKGQGVVIYGDGGQERDFVYVDDVVEANMLALEQTDSAIYNIGTGRGTSVNTLFDLLSRLTGSDKPVETSEIA